MLIVLVALDATAALSQFIAWLPDIQLAEDHTNQIVFELGLGQFFQWSSWTWTTCISVHMLWVLNTTAEANSDAERRQEKMYVLLLFLIQGCIYLPCMVFFLFVEDPPDTNIPGTPEANNLQLEPSGFQHLKSLQIVFLCLQYICILTTTYLTHFQVPDRQIVSQGATVQKYRQQMRWFLLAFLLSTIQVLADQVLQAAGMPVLYLESYGYLFSFYLGFWNALIWGGISGACQSCLVRVIKTGASERTLQMLEHHTLTLPLLQPQSAQPHDAHAHSHAHAHLKSQSTGVGCSEELIRQVEIPAAQLQIGQYISQGSCSCAMCFSSVK